MICFFKLLLGHLPILCNERLNSGACRSGRSQELGEDLMLTMGSHHNRDPNPGSLLRAQLSTTHLSYYSLAPTHLGCTGYLTNMVSMLLSRQDVIVLTFTHSPLQMCNVTICSLISPPGSWEGCDLSGVENTNEMCYVSCKVRKKLHFKASLTNLNLL